MNRLAAETSPYLRQHAGNPVDWYPWGPEALQRAQADDKPILLSVGYSACHWCHVMAHESFENAVIAARMNELFVNIKVDREERPDIDSIYMQAVQAMSGHGGWPMTVFLTPDGRPFFGGTYFPPEDRGGMPGFLTVINAVEQTYRERRSDVEAMAEQLRASVQPTDLRTMRTEPTELAEASARLIAAVDNRNGGFSRAPKFPHASALEFLLRRAKFASDAGAHDAALLTLDKMMYGGIYDQIGGGFHRYSVDASWTVPHFEKMLYDNAQLAPVYLHAFQITGNTEYRRVATQTLDYLVREMQIEAGGFASATDADSEGREGIYFTWTPAQIREALGSDEDAAVLCRYFGVTETGNFEAASTVLTVPLTVDQLADSLGGDAQSLRHRIDAACGLLLEARRARVAPGRDDKILAGWNGLAISALAEAGLVLGRSDYVAAAVECAEFLRQQMYRDGVLYRAWKDDAVKTPGFLEDYAAAAGGLLALFEATGNSEYFRFSLELAAQIIERFRDNDGAYFDTPSGAETLIARPMTLDDNPLPSGRTLAAALFWKLAHYTGDMTWHERCEEIWRPLSAVANRSPLSVAALLLVIDQCQREAKEIAIAGDRASGSVGAMLEMVAAIYDPYRVIAWGDGEGVPVMANRSAVSGPATAYVCRNFVCDLPVTDLQGLQSALA